MMKAIRAHEWCEPSGLRIDEIEIPQPGRGEVLVKVGAAALNFPDILVIQGKYQVKPELPFIPGMEIAGVIEKLGEDVAGFKPGQRVMAHTGFGAFAEYVKLPSESLHLIPEGMPDDEAAGFALVYQTSYFGLAYRGQLKRGETVLVHS
ncbi:alcohol dehydrogenase catalytic domain-containing protein, partial [Candidatus Sumerlaeota bacterium]|nr:alcohol dehydrogenase catalytic domain-containing protein [Candidatus Sumerlaeota bacterium]